MNYYNNMLEAGTSNWNLVVEMFTGKCYLYQPKDLYSSYDAILKKDDKIILLEVKRRQFTNDYLVNNYKSEFILERDKVDRIMNDKEYIEQKYNKKIYCWYLNKTSDGYTYIFDITNNNFKYIKYNIVNATYSDNSYKRIKYVSMLNIDKSIKIIKSNIMN